MGPYPLATIRTLLLKPSFLFLIRMLCNIYKLKALSSFWPKYGSGLNSISSIFLLIFLLLVFCAKRCFSWFVKRSVKSTITSVDLSSPCLKNVGIDLLSPSMPQLLMQLDMDGQPWCADAARLGFCV